MPIDTLLTVFALQGDARLRSVLGAMQQDFGRVESASERMNRIGGNVALAGSSSHAREGATLHPPHRKKGEQ